MLLAVPTRTLVSPYWLQEVVDRGAEFLTPYTFSDWESANIAELRSHDEVVLTATLTVPYETCCIEHAFTHITLTLGELLEGIGTWADKFHRRVSELLTDLYLDRYAAKMLENMIFGHTISD